MACLVETIQGCAVKFGEGDCFLSLFHVQADLTAERDGDKDIQRPLFGRLSADTDKAPSDGHILATATHETTGSYFD